MHAELEDFKTGWFGISLEIKVTEIDQLIKMLELLKKMSISIFILVAILMERVEWEISR